MIHYKSLEEIELIRKAAQLVSITLGEVAKRIGPGVLPIELDKLAEECIRDHGGVPCFKGYDGFPSTLCFSVNDQVVHGIPGKVPLKDGDIASVDCGAILNGFVGDHAYTFTIGEVSPRVRKLLRVTEECLYLGVAQCVAGNKIGDIGNAIQNHAEKNGFGVVRSLVGHGLGRDLHEDPQVANYGKRGTGVLIKEGLVLAIEPMINMGQAGVKELKDGWTVVTQDRLPSAHFEHDVAVINGQPVILSTFKYVHEALGIIPVTAA